MLKNRLFSDFLVNPDLHLIFQTLDLGYLFNEELTEALPCVDFILQYNDCENKILDCSFIVGQEGERNPSVDLKVLVGEGKC